MVEWIRIALINLSRHRNRVRYTFFALIIATAVMVVLLSYTDALRSQIEPHNLDKIYIISTSEYKFSPAEVETFNSLEHVSLATGRYVASFYGRDISITATGVDFEKEVKISNLKIEKGNLPIRLNEVAYIGISRFSEIGGNTEYIYPANIGQTIEIEDNNGTVELKITGLARVEENSYLSGPLVPIEFFRGDANNIVIKVDNPDNIEMVYNKVKTLLEGKYPVTIFSPKINYEIQKKRAESFSWLLLFLTLASVIISGLTVTNTMLDYTLERRIDIGIMKAIGATNSQVLKMISIEVVIISLISVAIGIFLGYILSILINSIAKVMFSFLPQGAVLLPVTWKFLIIAFVSTMVIGIVFGLIPALIASRTKPVEVLRYGE